MPRNPRRARALGPHGMISTQSPMEALQPAQAGREGINASHPGPEIRGESRRQASRPPLSQSRGQHARGSESEQDCEEKANRKAQGQSESNGAHDGGNKEEPAETFGQNAREGPERRFDVSRSQVVCAETGGASQAWSRGLSLFVRTLPLMPLQPRTARYHGGPPRPDSSGVRTTAR